MDPDYVNALLEEFGKHVKIVQPDFEMFREKLLNIEIPNSKRFYHDLTPNGQTIDDSGRVHRLEIRKVLINELAEENSMPEWKKYYNHIAKKFNSTNALTRDLRTRPDIVDIMKEAAENGQPYSLIAKLTTYDYGTPASKTKVTKQPFLLIPGVSNNETYIKAVSAWESANYHRR